ncbi:MAG: DUF6502 family protein [Alsobacter sp.]
MAAKRPSGGGPAADVPPPITAAQVHGPLKRLLRPLVRLCIRSGMTFPALDQLLRELFVNVAETEFALDGKEQTDSRVSLLTGINRKEVARLRGAGAPVRETPASLSRTSAIVARWLSQFVDERGEPMALPRFASDDSPSFEALVASVTKDVRPRAVLDEWLDRQLVRIDGQDRVILVEAAFVPRGDDDRKWHYFGRNIHDHVTAAVANVSSSTPPFMERAVHYDGLSPQLARDLEESSRKLAMEALKSANAEADRSLASDQGGGSRWIFGVYVLREDATATPEDPKGNGPA